MFFSFRHSYFTVTLTVTVILTPKLIHIKIVVNFTNILHELKTVRVYLSKGIRFRFGFTFTITIIFIIVRAYLGWSIPVPFTLTSSTPVTFTVTFTSTFNVTFTATYLYHYFYRYFYPSCVLMYIVNTVYMIQNDSKIDIYTTSICDRSLLTTQKT